MRWIEPIPAEMLFVVAAMLTVPAIGCAKTMIAGGDAGCISYEEARLAMPPAETLDQLVLMSENADRWAQWIADLDDRMTGTCLPVER